MVWEDFFLEDIPNEDYGCVWLQDELSVSFVFLTQLNKQFKEFALDVIISNGFS